MKNKVLDFLSDGSGIPEERYNKAMELYRKSEGNSPAAVNYYNRAGYTVHNLDNICYDLKKLYQITDAEILNISFLAKTSALDAEKAEKTEHIKGVAVGFVPNNPEQSNSMANGTGNLLSTISEAPAEAKAGFKIREEFPFLGQPDCPDKLKILVADMFTAWDNYKAAHAELLKITEEGAEPRGMTDAEIFEIANGAIEDFELNRSIWAELDYYKEHKKILGNHPIFADEMLKEAVAKMSSAEALKKRNNLRTYISRETKKLKPETAPDAADKIRAKIKDYTQEMELLNERLGE